jgi:hypothetical protein
LRELAFVIVWITQVQICPDNQPKHRIAEKLESLIVCSATGAFMNMRTMGQGTMQLPEIMKRIGQALL